MVHILSKALPFPFLFSLLSYPPMLLAMSMAAITLSFCVLCRVNVIVSMDHFSHSGKVKSSAKVSFVIIHSNKLSRVSIHNCVSPTVFSSSTMLLKSYSAKSHILLSNSLYALTCFAVKSLAMIQGTVSIPNCCAASSLPCQAITSLFLSIIIGLRNPNSFIEFAIISTCLVECILLFLANGLILSRCTSIIFMSLDS